MPAPDAEKALRKAIRARGPFEPVYYLHGADDYLKEDALRELVASAVDPATRDFNLDVRTASELDPETLGSLLGTPPMMAERRVVVLRDVQAMKKDARGALEHYLAHPAPDLMLVMVAPAGESRKGDDGLRARSCPVEFVPLDDERLPKWIAHHAKEEHGATITPDACAMLHSSVGNDLPALASEIDKLASYTSGAAIDEEAVAAVVGVRRGETLADLLDRVAQRDAAGALAVLSHVMEQPKMGGVPVGDGAHRANAGAGLRCGPPCRGNFQPGGGVRILEVLEVRGKRHDGPPVGRRREGLGARRGAVGCSHRGSRARGAV